VKFRHGVVELFKPIITAWNTSKRPLFCPFAEFRWINPTFSWKSVFCPSTNLDVAKTSQNVISRGRRQKIGIMYIYINNIYAHNLNIFCQTKPLFLRILYTNRRDTVDFVCHYSHQMDLGWNLGPQLNGLVSVSKLFFFGWRSLTRPMDFGHLSGKAEAKPSPTTKSVPKLLPTSKASVRPREALVGPW